MSTMTVTKAGRQPKQLITLEVAGMTCTVTHAVGGEQEATLVDCAN